MSAPTPSAQALATLKLVEAFVAQQGAQWATAPDQRRAFDVLAAELKAGREGALASTTARQALRELFVWQLELHREKTKARLATLKDPANAGNAIAKKTQLALERVLKMLDDTERAVRSPDPAAAQRLAAAEAGATRAFDDLSASVDLARAAAASAPRARAGAPKAPPPKSAGAPPKSRGPVIKG